MAFDRNYLSLIVDSIGGGSLRVFAYNLRADHVSDAFVAGYITDCAKSKVKVSDSVLLFDQNGRMSGAILDSIDDDGDGTLVPDRTGNELARTKSPITDWADIDSLVLGTSIPAQGQGLDSYHDRALHAVGANAPVNVAWAGSHVNFDPTDDPTINNSIRALSMTEDDRVYYQTYYNTAPNNLGDDNQYEDGNDPITLPSEQTADFRIKTQFAANTFDVVFLDHNHNDRRKETGSMTEVTRAVLGVTKGATTVLTLFSADVFAVGDGISVPMVGIPKLNHVSARVMAVNHTTNTVTINVNSSGYSGSFVSGTAHRYDRSLIIDSYRFVIHYIRWCANLYYGDDGSENIIIIMSSAPSEYTQDVYDADINSVRDILYEVALDEGVTFFDIGRSLDLLNQSDQIRYFEDSVHPLTPAQRQVVANHWAQWMKGGSTPTLNEYDFLPAGASSFDEGRVPRYNRFKGVRGGFTTSTRVNDTPYNVYTADFSAGTSGWSAVGTAPVAGDAPWSALEDAILCHSQVGATTSYLQKSLTFVEGVIAEMDVYFPVVSGTVPEFAVATVGLLDLRSSGGYLGLQAILHETTTEFRVVYFTEPNDGLVNFTASNFVVEAATKYNVRFEAVRETATDKGGILLYVDDVLISGPFELSDILQTNVATVRMGITFCNSGGNFDVYIGNAVFETFTSHNAAMAETMKVAALGSTNNSASGSAAYVLHDLLYAMQPGYLAAAKTLRVSAYFTITTGSAAPNLRVGLYAGSTRLANSNAVTPGNNISGESFISQFLVHAPAAAGATASVYSSIMSAPTTPRQDLAQPVSVATNAAKDLKIATFWSAAGTGTSTITLTLMLVEALN